MNCSINANNGKEQGRKDDMESFGYTLLDLLMKKLPWVDTKEIKYAKTNKERFEKTLEIKQNVVDTLCDGLPKEFSEYMKYCRNLKFEEEI